MPSVGYDAKRWGHCTYQRLRWNQLQRDIYLVINDDDFSFSRKYLTANLGEVTRLDF